jgi:hypothetical protein
MGNLSLSGSAANLIVCEQAGRAPNLSYRFGLDTHKKFVVELQKSPVVEIYV